MNRIRHCDDMILVRGLVRRRIGMFGAEVEVIVLSDEVLVLMMENDLSVLR